MYTGYFGLSERPFSIAPDPQYLFLSDRHREALAHLTFGLGDSGGFALLTGEVGTGKTTVSRCLMEQIPDDTQTAFVLNPSLSEQELLATICDEYRIRYRKADATIKVLTDKIRNRLIKNHENGINTLLIIDEAQHLRAEVLEQLRLLTNLETDKKKLLKVILIGQPELQHLLKRQELRQLAQRITARYHLLPLTEQEVGQYVAHRLHVAGCERPLFDNGAIKKIHQLSSGIPRLINLLCDRALLGAYSQHLQQVTKQVVDQAANEALGGELPVLSQGSKQSSSPSQWPMYVFTIFMALVVGLASYWFTMTQTAHQASDPLTLIQQQATVANSPDRAFASLLTLWQLPRYSGNNVCQQVEAEQLQCFTWRGDLNGLISLNRPAVLQLTDKVGRTFYGVLSGADGSKVQVTVGEHSFSITQPQLLSIWQGSAVLLWRPPLEKAEVITKDSDIERVQWLENSLSYYFKRQPRALDVWDSALSQDLRLFQQQQRLPGSEIADMRTIIQLNDALQLPSAKIRSTGAFGKGSVL